MQEFILTSKEIPGNMRFAYDDKGILVQFENNAELTDQQVNYLVQHFPLRVNMLNYIKGNSRIEEVTDLSFEAFWNKYGYKEGKIKAREQWEKLNKNDKMSAMAGIKSFQIRRKMNNTALLYPERYIKYRSWEDGK